MSLDPFLPVLLQALLIGVYGHKGRETGEHIRKLMFLFLQFSGNLVAGLFEKVELYLVRLLQLLNDGIIVTDRPG